MIAKIIIVLLSLLTLNHQVLFLPFLKQIMHRLHITQLEGSNGIHEHSIPDLLVLKAELRKMWVKRVYIRARLAGRFSEVYKCEPNIEEIRAEVWFGWAPTNSDSRMETT